MLDNALEQLVIRLDIGQIVADLHVPGAVIELAGGATEPEIGVFVSGIMMGRLSFDLDDVITKTTAGLIGGGPTFIGALIGGFWVSGIVSVLFLSLAGGAVIYVVKELLYHGKISGEGFATMSSLVAGFVAGFVSLVAVHYLVGA